MATAIAAVPSEAACFMCLARTDSCAIHAAVGLSTTQRGTGPGERASPATQRPSGRQGAYLRRLSLVHSLDASSWCTTLVVTMTPRSRQHESAANTAARRPATGRKRTCSLVTSTASRSLEARTRLHTAWTIQPNDQLTQSCAAGFVVSQAAPLARSNNHTTYMSEGCEGALPSSTSGAAYSIVICTDMCALRMVLGAEAKARRLEPQSATSGMFRSGPPRNTFPGFKSPWTTFIWWTYASACKWERSKPCHTAYHRPSPNAPSATTEQLAASGTTTATRARNKLHGPPVQCHAR